MKQMVKTAFALIMAAVMAAAYMPAMAVQSFADSTKVGYLLVNIPYSEYYGTEVGAEGV